jgi:hypothetical protein
VERLPCAVSSTDIRVANPIIAAASVDTHNPCQKAAVVSSGNSCVALNPKWCAISIPEEKIELLVNAGCSESASETESDSLLFESRSFQCSEDSKRYQYSEGFSNKIETLREFYIRLALFYFAAAKRPSNGSGSSSNENYAYGRENQGKEKYRTTSPPAQKNHRSHPYKRLNRRRAGEIDGNDETDDEGDNDNATHPEHSIRARSEDGCLFACPFVKRYPGLYFKCYGHNLKDVSRVKYHLFRDKAHRLPIYSPTCSMTFDDENTRDEHTRAANCLTKPPV